MEGVSSISRLVTVEQLVDLAVGTPEAGVINLTVLHSLLHVIVQQMNIQRCLVEFRNDDAENIEGVIQSAKPGPTLKLSEYNIDINEAEKIMARDKTLDQKTNMTSKIQKQGVKDPVRRNTTQTKEEDKLQKEQQPEKTNKDEQDRVTGKNVKQEEEKKTERGKKGQRGKFQKRCPCSVDDGNNDEDGTGGKGNRYSDDDGDLADSGKSKSKRQGPTYYGSEGKGLQTVVLVEKVGEDCSCDTWRQRPALSNLSLNKLEERVVKIQEFFELLEGLPSNNNLIARTKEGTKYLPSACNTPVADMWQLFNLSKRTESAEIGIKKLATMIEDILKDLGKMQQNEGKEVKDLTEKKDAEIIPDRKNIADESTPKGNNESLNELSAKVNALMDFMNKMNSAGSWTEILEKLSCLPNCAVMAKLVDLIGLREEVAKMKNSFNENDLRNLFEKLNSLPTQVETVAETSKTNMIDKEQLDELLTVMKEEIEFLKIRKADKEIVEEELADKADKNELDKKVNTSAFNDACKEIIRSIENVLSKVSAQEISLHEAVEELLSLLEEKLDKTEIQALKDFLNVKLKSLQDKLKALSMMQKEIEAAGAKKKVMRDLKCISCDDDVVMKVEVPIGVDAPSLSPQYSMKPYLTYELDQMRKMFKQAATGQNRHEVSKEEQNVGKERRKKKSQELGDEQLTKLGIDHVCNRYCGGSHTITTPQQRVTRIGHFLQEYGPQAISIPQPSDCQDKLI